MGNPEHLARIHEPAHARPLSDACDHLRRASAALAATWIPRAADAAELRLIHAAIRDQLRALERIHGDCLPPGQAPARALRADA